MTTLADHLPRASSSSSINRGGGGGKSTQHAQPAVAFIDSPFDAEGDGTALIVTSKSQQASQQQLEKGRSDVGAHHHHRRSKDDGADDSAGVLAKTDEEEDEDQQIKETLRALRIVQNQMVKTREDRKGLKAAMASADVVLGAHHAHFALDNVTRARTVDDLRALLDEKERCVAQLKRDHELAVAEHHRLEVMNAQWLAVISDREAKRQELKAQLASVSASQQRSLEFLEQVTAEAKRVELQRKKEAAALQQAMGMVGTHHSTVVREQNAAMELKLERDSLRAKLGLPRLAGVPEAANAALWRACDKPTCVRARRELRELEMAWDINARHSANQH